MSEKILQAGGAGDQREHAGQQIQPAERCRGIGQKQWIGLLGARQGIFIREHVFECRSDGVPQDAERSSEKTETVGIAGALPFADQDDGIPAIAHGRIGQALDGRLVFGVPCPEESRNAGRRPDRVSAQEWLSGRQ